MEKDHLQIILENMDMDSKFDELNEKIGFLDFKIDTVNENLSKKLMPLAAI